MFKIVETFSGIGSQAKAFQRLNIEHEVVATVEWDINAICAYDIIHNGKPDLSVSLNMDKMELIDILLQYSLSSNGKNELSRASLTHLSEEAIRHIYSAIIRTKNLVSIKDVSARDLPDDIDLLTYSFPCQDLSICGFWHGNKSGIDRDACNRSGMLWEIERILFDRHDKKLKMPRYLLMENVSNILSDTHRENFDEWKSSLVGLGYYNKIYTLNAKDFGIPQNRVRVFMLSVLCDSVDRLELKEYFENHDLTESSYRENFICKKPLIDFLRLDYDIPKYHEEAVRSQPNFTPSRIKIFEESVKINKNSEVLVESITTITTKQDRNPNSGLIDFDPQQHGKAPYRNLTPRECFLLMGFDEFDYQKIVDYNFSANVGRNFFTDSKLIKMAGNSIVVNVLEAIFKQIIEIDELFIKRPSLPIDGYSRDESVKDISEVYFIRPAEKAI